jgi:hypothetical protein
MGGTLLYPALPNYPVTILQKNPPKSLTLGLIWCRVRAMKMTTEEMLRDYEVRGFALGICVVKRREDGVLGTLDFDHYPRFYYNFQEA